jgi:hypothetical protein
VTAMLSYGQVNVRNGSISRPFCRLSVISGLPARTDIIAVCRHVSKVPIAEIINRACNDRMLPEQRAMQVHEMRDAVDGS